MSEVIDMELPNAWWPDRVPEACHVLLEADDMLIALIAYADSQGRYYGDPLLVAGLFWRQDPPLSFVTQCIYELIDRHAPTVNNVSAPVNNVDGATA